MAAQAETLYYVMIDGTGHGPYPVSELVAMAQRNEIHWHTQCMDATAQDQWVALRDIREAWEGIAAANRQKAELRRVRKSNLPTWGRFAFFTLAWGAVLLVCLFHMMNVSVSAAAARDSRLTSLSRGPELSIETIDRNVEVLLEAAKGCIYMIGSYVLLRSLEGLVRVHADWTGKQEAA